MPRAAAAEGRTDSRAPESSAAILQVVRASWPYTNRESCWPSRRVKPACARSFRFFLTIADTASTWMLPLRRRR